MMQARRYAFVFGMTMFVGAAGSACSSGGKSDFPTEAVPSHVPSATAAVTSTATAAPATATTIPAAATPPPTSGPAACKYVPTGTTFSISPPAAGVPAGLVGFSGAWEGLWGGAAANTSVFVVRSVTAARIEATYVFQGVASPMNFDLPPGSTAGPLNFGTTVAFSWSLSPDAATLGGARTQAGQTIAVTMQRCKLP